MGCFDVSIMDGAAIAMKADHASEVARGQRFEFGKNWARFLRELDDKRIDMATDSLRQMLGLNDLRARSFLDIGCGSGLFSLAARQLGATVFSFDFDPESVECARELKRMHFPQDALWKIDSGSALDSAYMNALGEYDVVYSWGVLHHTGAMWQALENAVIPCRRGGLLFIAIYNDQGETSRMWTAVKRLYNLLPRPGKLGIVLSVGAFFRVRHAIARAVHFNNPFTMRERARGMSWFRDVVDWVGGYPFEVASPEDIFDFFRARGFTLLRMKTTRGGHGCNEFVFRREQ
jgi:2-polyprenyl-3-methyl-5-hydroxy-6-metoxy-1,4-benzoquinol methylase